MKTRALRAALRGLARLMVYPTLGLALAYGALHFYGLPGFAERRLLAELDRRGVIVRVRDIRLEWPAALVARQVRVHTTRAAGAPVAEAREVLLRFGRDDATRRWTLNGAVARGLRIQPGAEPERYDAGWRAAAPAIEVSDAELEFAPEGLRIRHADARFGGLRWRLAGTIAASAQARGSALPADWPQRLRAQTDRWTAVARALEEFQMRSPPSAHAWFFVDPDDPSRNFARGSLRCGAGWWRGLPVLGAQLRGDLRGRDVRISSAEIRFARGRIAASAEVLADANTVRARIEGRLPFRDWLALPLPPAARPWVEPLRLSAGEVDVEIETDGAVGLDSALERLRGRVALGPGEALDIPFDRLSLRFQREGYRLRIPEFEAVVGAGRGRGPARGSVEIATHTGDFAARLDMAFDPTLLMPLFTEPLATAAGAVVFTGAPPRIQLDAAGVWGRDASLRIGGRIEAEDFIYNGAAVRRAETDLEKRDDTLRLWNTIIERPEGRLTGRLTQRFAAREAEFEILSTLSPHALARMISPFTHRLAQQFRFEGPVRVEGRGRATYGGRDDHDFDLSVEGERMGVRWVLADRLAFTVEARGDRIELRNIQGEWHGGRGEGEVELTLTPGREPVRYRARGRLDGADLAGIVRDLGDTDASAYSGRVYAEGRLEGAIGDGQGRAAVGEGRLAVRDGQLLRIPLFGGLSHGLSRIFPGLGFAAQSAFTADVTLSEGRLRTENAQLLGSTLSLRARGYYDIENRLQIAAQVKLLRAGPIASVLRFVTWPITRLMEFDVSGPPQQPRWEPRNLPKELFLMFD